MPTHKKWGVGSEEVVRWEGIRRAFSLLITHHSQRATLCLVLLLLLAAPVVWGDTATHALPDPTRQRQQWFGDYHDPRMLSGCLPTVPGSGTTLPTMACEGYVRDSTTRELVYVNQATKTISLSGGNGTYWLALHKDRSTSVAAWTRQTATHYLWRVSSTQPATPSHGLVFAKITVAAGAITAVERIYTRGDERVLVVTDPPYLADPLGLSESSTAINQALLDAGTSYATVFLPCGTYKTTAQIAMQAGVTLEGASKDCAIIAPDTATSIPRPIVADSVSNVTIKNLQVDCGDATVTGRQGIASLNSSTYVTIDSVSVRRCGQYGVLLHGDTSSTPFSSGGAGNILRNSKIDMTGIPSGACTGIIAVEYFPKGPSLFLAEPGPLVQGNTIIAENSDVGIKVSQATGARIIGNYVSGAECSTSTGAIDSGPGTTNMLIANNVIRDTRLGIVFGGLPRAFASGGNDLRSSKHTIVNNTLSFIAAAAIYSSDGATDVVIQGNNISLDTGSPAGTHGIDLKPTAAASGGAAYTRLSIVGNTLLGFETNVLLQKDSGGTLGYVDLVIDGNTLSTSSGDGNGMLIELADGALVTSNKIVGGKIGVNFVAASAGVVIDGNVMHDLNTDNDANDPCIQVVGNRPVITNNVCYQGTGGHSDYGITLNATVDATIHGNKFIAMETGDLLLVNTGSMTSGTPHLQEKYVHQTAVAGAADTAENTLAAVVVPRSYFTLYGGVKIVAFGDTTGAGGVKSLRLYFGGSILGAALSVAAGTNAYRVEAEVVMAGGTAAEHTWISGWDGVTLEQNAYNSLTVNTASSTVTIHISCQKADGADTCRHRALLVQPWR